MIKKLLLIVNPHSGTGKMRTQLLKVVEIFSNADYSVTVYPTKARGDATLKVKSLSNDDYDLIVVCGGDGTLNEVITGLMGSKVSCPLGYIPSGTLNEWSQGLGISKNIAKAANDIVNGNVIPLDIGKFDDKYFSYTASFGAFTSASYSAPQEIKNVLGKGVRVAFCSSEENDFEVLRKEDFISFNAIKKELANRWRYKVFRIDTLNDLMCVYVVIINQ